MKFKRQYILTLNIEADNAKGANYSSRILCNMIRGLNMGGGGTHGFYDAKIYSITPKSLNPKILLR